MTDVIIIFSRYQNKIQSDSTTICNIHQQLNNIEICHIHIFNIAGTMPITSAIQSKINNVS